MRKLDTMTLSYTFFKSNEVYGEPLSSPPSTATISATVSRP